jgi:hypothetical protein
MRIQNSFTFLHMPYNVNVLSLIDTHAYKWPLAHTRQVQRLSTHFASLPLTARPRLAHQLSQLSSHGPPTPELMEEKVWHCWSASQFFLTQNLNFLNLAKYIRFGSASSLPCLHLVR